MTLGPLMIDLKGVAIEPDERDLLLHPLVGGVILFSRNYESPEQLCRLTAELRGLRATKKRLPIRPPPVTSPAIQPRAKCDSGEVRWKLHMGMNSSRCRASPADSW